MLYAEWSGRRVVIRTEAKMMVREFNVDHNVVGVQISGDSTTDATVAIAMDNGRTCLYKSSGMLLRK